MIKVLIADDQKTVQELLKSYIEDDPYLDFIGCANNGQEALDMVKTYRPNIVLMDIEMPVLDGLAATKIISEQFVDTNVLIISVHNEDSYLNAALQVGAKGYLLKNTPARELVNAVNSAYKGYFQLGPGLLEKYLHKISDAQVNNQEIRQLKTMVMQQSEYIENLNQSQQVKAKINNNNNPKDSHYHVANQYARLEKQLYIIKNRVNKQSKKIAFIQQLCNFIILCCAVMVILLFSFST